MLPVRARSPTCARAVGAVGICSGERLGAAVPGVRVDGEAGAFVVATVIAIGDSGGFGAVLPVGATSTIGLTGLDGGLVGTGASMTSGDSGNPTGGAATVTAYDLLIGFPAGSMPDQMM